MTGDLIANVSVGLGMAVPLVGLFAWLRADIVRVEARLREDIQQLAARVERLEQSQIRLEQNQIRLEHGHARLEGLIEGLREAVAGRAAQ